MDRQRRSEWLEYQLEEAIAGLEEQLNEGYSEGFLEILDWYSRFRKYSLANTLLILQQKPDATLCAGFRAWAKLGYHVRQGEKAIWVRGPVIRKRTDPATGEETEYVAGYIPLPIFDISQLVEKVTPPDFTRALEGDWSFYYSLAVATLGSQGIFVHEDTLPQGIHGLSTGGKIYINQTLSDSEKFVCLLHELCHELLHQGENKQDTTKEQRELEAEAGSYLIARLYGLENPYAKDYILSWHGTVQGLHDSLTRIHLAVKQAADMLGVTPPLEIPANPDKAA